MQWRSDIHSFAAAELEFERSGHQKRKREEVILAQGFLQNGPAANPELRSENGCGCLNNSSRRVALAKLRRPGRAGVRDSRSNTQKH
jgi:hypothetical protein